MLCYYISIEKGMINFMSFLFYKGGENMKEQYKIFCDEYIKTLDASKSYKKAYPKAKQTTCQVNGCNLLKKDEIQEYLKKRFKEASNERVADVQEVLETLTRVMRQEETEQTVVTKMVGNGISEVEIVEKKPCLREVLKAAELLGKRYAMFTDKVDLENNVAVTIIDDIGTLEDE